MTFEDAILRMKEISAELDKPELPLQKAVELYAEAVELEKICSEELKNAKLSLEKVETDEQ